MFDTKIHTFSIQKDVVAGLNDYHLVVGDVGSTLVQAMNFRLWYFKKYGYTAHIYTLTHGRFLHKNILLACPQEESREEDIA